MKKLPFKSATYNVLDGIDRHSPFAIDDCNDIAQALVVRMGDEGEGKHFLDAAEEHISAVAASVVAYANGEARSLQKVAEVLAIPEKLDKAKELMLTSDYWNGMLARMGGKLKHYVERERGSVLTTTGLALRFLNTPAMAESTRMSSFTPMLKAKRQTIYIVLPPERMKACQGWLRLMVGAMIRSVVKEGLTEYPNVHYVLDESASLGVLDSIEDLLDKYRGYGCRAQFYYQSAGQLKKCWPKDQGQTLMSNCSARIFFGVNDLETATLVSSMGGKQTVIVESGGTGTSGGTNRGWSQGSHHSESGGRNQGWSSSDNWQQMARELLKPEEVMGLPPRTAITFPGFGVSPMLTTLVPYWLQRSEGGKLGAAGTFLMSALLFVIALVLAIAVTFNLMNHLPERFGGF